MFVCICLLHVKRKSFDQENRKTEPQPKPAKGLVIQNVFIRIRIRKLYLNSVFEYKLWSFLHKKGGLFYFIWSFLYFLRLRLFFGNQVYIQWCNSIWHKKDLLYLAITSIKICSSIVNFFQNFVQYWYTSIVIQLWKYEIAWIFL